MDNPAPVLGGGGLIDSRAKTLEMDDDDNWMEHDYENARGE